MMKLKFFIILIVSFPIQNSSLGHELTEKLINANTLLERADSLVTLRKYDLAAVEFQSAAKKYRIQENWEQYFECLTQELVCYWKGDFQFKADLLIEKIAAETSEIYNGPNSKQARAYNILGIYYKEKGLYDQALTYHQKALSIWTDQLESSNYLIGHANHNIGNIYNRKGAYDLALDYYAKAFNIYIEHYEKHPSRVALSYNNQGLVFQRKGSYNLALEHFEQAMSIWVKVFGENSKEVAVAHNNMGTTYSCKGLYNTAMMHYTKALGIYSDIYGKEHYLTASPYFNMGDVYYEQEIYDLALENYSSFIKIWSNQYGFNHPRTAYGLIFLGTVYHKMRNYDMALKQYQRALEISKNLLGPKHPQIALCHNKIGEVFMEMEKYNKADIHYREALEANLISGLTQKSQFTQDALDNKVLLNSFQGRVRALEQIKASSSSYYNLETALNILHKSDTLIDHIRHSEINQEDKLELGKSIPEVYESAIRISLKLSKLTNNGRFKELAFYFSEKSKVGVLREALSNHSAKNFGVIPNKVLAFEKRLRVDLSFYRSHIQLEKTKKGGYDTVKIGNWEEKLFHLKRSRDSLANSLEQLYPRYYELKYQNYIVTTAQVQSQLNKNQAIIEYFVGSQNSYTFIVTTEDIQVNTSPNEIGTQNQIAEFRNTVESSIDFQQSGFLNYTSQAYTLYVKYLKNALDTIDTRITQLSIIPDGHLSYIPFDILLTNEPKGSEIDYKSLPYLLKKYEINYAYSATLLFRDFNTKRLQGKELIAFAPVYNTNTTDSTRSILYGEFRDQVTGLKWNQPEIDRITKHMDGIKLLGQDASEADFKKHVGEFNVVHLAMHALVDDTDPMNSKLIFTAENDSIEDGLLHAHELYNMEIPAELVVLSACQTGLGKLSKGEGVMSLARAFSYAGCPSVVMSHWSVNDESTADLMDRFYKNLSEGQSKGQALRHAKLSFLEENFAPQTHPLFWGSFVVMGDTSPLKNTEDWNWILISIVCLLAASAIFYIARRSMQNSSSAISK